MTKMAIEARPRTASARCARPKAAPDARSWLKEIVIAMPQSAAGTAQSARQGPPSASAAAATKAAAASAVATGECGSRRTVAESAAPSA
jgi:hypothetical protein